MNLGRWWCSKFHHHRLVTERDRITGRAKLVGLCCDACGQWFYPLREDPTAEVPYKSRLTVHRGGRP